MATQSNWRFCTKCYCLFFAGNSTQGSCAAGGTHNANASSPGEQSTPAGPQGGSQSANYLLTNDPV
jgi:hypothetical protein